MFGYYLMPSVQFFWLQVTPAFSKDWQHLFSLPQLLTSIIMIALSDLDKKQVTVDEAVVNNPAV